LAFAFGAALVVGGGVGSAIWLVLRRPPKELRLVEIVTEGRGLGAVELERRATIPLEIAVNGASGVTAIRSETTQGRSIVRALLAPKADELSVRQEVMQRVQAAALPSAMASPVLAPAGSGVTLTYALVPESGATLATARAIQDWEVTRALLTVPGVVDVDTCGGREERVEVSLDRARSRALGIGPGDVANALSAAAAAFTRFEDVAAVVVATRNGAPVRVSDVARVALGVTSPSCIARREGKDELVLAEVVLRRGEDTKTVAAAVAARLHELTGRWPVRLEPLEMEARARWIHARVSGPDDALAGLVAAAHASPGVRDVFTRRRDDDADVELLARLDPASSPDQVATAMARAFDAVPATRYDLTSPARTLSRDVRIARVRIRGGGDLATLREIATKVVSALGDVPGVTGASAPDARQLPRVTVTPDRAALARLGVSAADVEVAVELSLAGRTVATLQQGARRLDVVVRIEAASAARAIPDVDLDVAGANGAYVSLGAVAQVKLEEEPARIVRDGGERVVDVLFDAKDARAFDAARAKLLASLQLPAGVSLTLSRAGDE
jgi:Cu/Ag efflux pump CusA